MPKAKNHKKKISPSRKPAIKPPRKVKKSKSARTRRLALGLITVGIIFILIPVLFYFNQTIQLAYFTPKAKISNQANKTSVSEISIPAAGINLKVKPTVIKNGAWEIARDGASYLSISAAPGTKGPIILYAHKTPERFGPILDLKPGKSIVVRTTDNKIHLYSIKKTMEVYPHQMEVFDQKDETLIIYTCSGFADLKRFIVLAKPSS